MGDSESLGASTKFRNLAERAHPLIDWYKANKPSVDHVHVTPQEFSLLQKFPDLAASYGFKTEKTPSNARIYLEGIRGHSCADRRLWKMSANSIGEKL